MENTHHSSPPLPWLVVTTDSEAFFMWVYASETFSLWVG